MRFVAIILAAAFLAACRSSPKEGDQDEKSGAITPGTVKLTIVKGSTTQAQVLDAFGPPDIVTHQDDQQVWTYDKTTYDYEMRSGYLTVIVAGQSSKSVKSGSRSNLLKVYFNSSDVVTDYRYQSVKY